MLLDHVRGEDIACRYGGDEFIVILPDASREVTCKRAELLSEYASNFVIPFEGKTLEQVTLSLGVAVFPKDGSTCAAILSTADRALYRAKQEGKGKIVLAN